MAVTEREYLEMIAKNIDKRMSDGFSAINETVKEIKETQKTNSTDIQNLKTEQTKSNGIFKAVGQIINFIGLCILAFFQYIKE